MAIKKPYEIKAIIYLLKNTRKPDITKSYKHS